MADRVLLLAGSVGPERVPARPDPHDGDWYLPLHLRDESAARQRITQQIESGADVVVAPTWLTHRRALLGLGETRRGGAWTAAAVRTARQGLEIGLERREETLAEAPQDDIRRGRPAPLVAASLPALDEEADSATGRLLPREVATERDYRDQAGILADAEPDLILVEGQTGQADARLAISQAVETGLPTWAALTSQALALDGLEGWLEWAGASGVEGLLLPGTAHDATLAAVAGLPWGTHQAEPQTVEPWLELGAGTVARLDGATRPAIEALRTAIDDYERAGIEAGRAAERRWHEAVSRAASMAPGGAAVWIGSPAATPLPAGFEWLVVQPEAMAQLPPHRFRLVVAPQRMDPRRLARIPETGGILLAPADPGLELRTLARDDELDPPMAIYRRERGG